MTYKQFSRIILAFVVITFLAIAEYNFWHNGGFAKYETRVVAAGTINGKFESDYSCGSKGKYTCYARYLTIDGVNHEVNLETFTTSYNGQYVTLTKEVKVNDSFWNVVCIITHICIWLFSGAIIVLVFSQFIYWSVVLSDKITLKNFYRNVWLGGK